MTPEIKDFTTWTEAERWLARHGWGLGLIEQQKELWDANLAAKTAESVAKVTAKVTEPAAKK
jgi:hypothetical protein